MEAKQKCPGKITWDEETIARHDLDRGTRMKIDEPNTPYSYYDAENDSKLDSKLISPTAGVKTDLSSQWDELNSKLEDHVKHKDAIKAGEWDEDSDNEKNDKKKFSSKRKQHYNEYQMMLQWRKEHANDVDEEMNE